MTSDLPMKAEHAGNPFRAIMPDMSVYIAGEEVFVEVSYIAFPRFTGSHCSYHSLVGWQRERLDADLEKASKLAATLLPGTSEKEIIRLFERMPDEPKTKQRP